VEIWWGFFAIPTFLWVKERARPKPVPEGQNLLTVGFHQLRSTARKLRLLPQLLLFMGAFFLYNDGIQTIITQGSVFADTLFHLEPGELIPVFLMIQIVAFLGSLLFIKIEGGARLRSEPRWCRGDSVTPEVSERHRRSGVLGPVGG
jgi:UMF1 family MFS transporter